MKKIHQNAVLANMESCINGLEIKGRMALEEAIVNTTTTLPCSKGSVAGVVQAKLAHTPWQKSLL